VQPATHKRGGHPQETIRLGAALERAKSAARLVQGGDEARADWGITGAWQGCPDSVPDTEALPCRVYVLGREHSGRGRLRFQWKGWMAASARCARALTVNSRLCGAGEPTEGSG